MRTTIANQRPREYGNAAKSLAGLKKQVTFGEISLVVPNQLWHCYLGPMASHTFKVTGRTTGNSASDHTECHADIGEGLA